MSSGTGRATSQYSGIDWKNKPRMVCRLKLLSRLQLCAGTGGQKPRSLASLGMTMLERFAFMTEILLGGFFRWLNAEIFHHHLQILPGLALLARIAQQIRGVIGHGEARARP